MPIDVRLISATNIDFAKEIENGRFRHDLYYRLNVIPVNLSPLRERSTDIPLFVEYFINKYNKLLNKKVNSFSKEALSALVNYDWPGNVRELQNLIERVVVLAKGKTIELSDLPLQSGANPETCLKTSLEIFEKNIIAQALKESKGNLSLAAKSLKTPRTSLITRMRLLGLS
ncbi:MAG: sigma 54-interacting transcriptional regulator [Candidatus Margulisbacteria bacterium]|nr:sigma 54-interacting transcriptional regulator [Candidatus Margulisiibacteriota bacterium]